MTAEEAAEIANGLVREGSCSPGQEITVVPHVIAAFCHATAEERRTVIGPARPTAVHRSRNER
ncbi:hypothetical protein Adi01nite_34950 [Amorphoplanes digitatis]|nr:hypothetical protein Adi01nite_34950 [Actinoplanes digitatis]